MTSKTKHRGLATLTLIAGLSCPAIGASGAGSATPGGPSARGREPALACPLPEALAGAFLEGKDRGAHDVVVSPDLEFGEPLR